MLPVPAFFLIIKAKQQLSKMPVLFSNLIKYQIVQPANDG